MTVVTLKPELRTAGGETISIYCDNDWAGDVYLVYREGDLLTGTVQIDTSRVNERNLDAVEDEVRSYISHLTSALAINTSTVVMMYGDIEQVLEMEPMDRMDEGFNEIVDTHDQAYETDAYETNAYETNAYETNAYETNAYETNAYQTNSYDNELDEQLDDELGLEEYYEDEGEGYHLTLLADEGDHVKYHLRDDYENVIGTVAVDEIADTVAGRVDFWVEPDKNEPEEVAEMLFDTFHADEVNSISFTMNYSDEHVGDIHLEREDCL